MSSNNHVKVDGTNRYLYEDCFSRDTEVHHLGLGVDNSLSVLRPLLQRVEDALQQCIMRVFDADGDACPIYRRRRVCEGVANEHQELKWTNPCALQGASRELLLGQDREQKFSSTGAKCAVQSCWQIYIRTHLYDLGDEKYGLQDQTFLKTFIRTDK